MKIMVIGVGVIGSYLYHVLCKNSREVTVLARGAGRRAGESACVSVSHIYPAVFCPVCRMKGRKLCFPAFLRENISRFMFQIWMAGIKATWRLSCRYAMSAMRWTVI